MRKWFRKIQICCVPKNVLSKSFSINDGPYVTFLVPTLPFDNCIFEVMWERLWSPSVPKMVKHTD